MADIEITRVSVYQVDLPLHEGEYKWSGGKSVTVFDSVVVRLETNKGISGVGEFCALGPCYLPAYADGARAGIKMLAPHLLGVNPTELGKVNQLLDRELKGHPYVKSAIDVACWDILGKVTGQPIVTLLGGRYGESYELYRAISQDEPAKMATNIQMYHAEGYRKFQLKLGSDVDTDIQRIRQARAVLTGGELLLGDANTGWLMHEAVRVINGVKDLDVYIEQPCESYEEMISVRQLCPLPFVMDENITDLQVLLRLLRDKAADAINLKISKVGGLTKARQIRDLAISAGLAMNIEDTWGGDIVTAAISHLAHSTPPQFLLASTDFNSYVTKSIAEGAPQRKDGRMAASTKPGLGLEARLDVLGDPIFVVEKKD